MFILTQFIEREFMCLLLRWPHGQSTMGNQYDKTTYISQSNQISWYGLREFLSIRYITILTINSLTKNTKYISYKFVTLCIFTYYP